MTIEAGTLESSIKTKLELTSLPGVGFHTKVEVNVLRESLAKGQESMLALEEWLVSAERNLRGYWQEYIDQRLVLPIELEFAEVNDKKRIVPKGIRGTTWADSVSVAERNGSIKYSVIKIEEFLLNAPKHSVAVLVSPGGCEYPDTQTYIFFKNEQEEIDAMTVRTDPDILDNETFLFNSSHNFVPLTNDYLDNRVENVIRNPLLLESDHLFGYSPESILEVIRATKTNDTAFKNKNFQQLFADFKNRFDFLESSNTIKFLIHEFVLFCNTVAVESQYKFGENIFSLFEQKLGEIILKMSYVKRHLQGRDFTRQEIFYRLDNLRREDYESELAFLQTIRGCAGGGLSTYSENGLGTRENSPATESAGLSPCCAAKLVCGCCSKCNRVIIVM